MRLFGVLALVGGYCCWYTLYTRTWGDGSGFLYNLTGSSRWGGAPQTSTSSSPKTPGPVNTQTGQPIGPGGVGRVPGGVGPGVGQ